MELLQVWSQGATVHIPRASPTTADWQAAVDGQVVRCVVHLLQVEALPAARCVALLGACFGRVSLSTQPADPDRVMPLLVALPGRWRVQE